MILPFVLVAVAAVYLLWQFSSHALVTPDLSADSPATADAESSRETLNAA
jgi:hypothetical protein